ncbi:hypothetical protein D1871_20335 [Nakamurella silvestris]|nr:hypothetical protein D1871_20335 [Nakamurella silvestris]
MSEPVLERHEVPVAAGEDAGSFTEFAYVRGGPPGGMAVECGLRERQGSPGQAGQQVFDLGVAQPDMGASGSRLSADRLVQREQGRADGPGAVVEQRREVVFEAAACAQSTSVWAVFLAASGAVEVFRDFCAVATDRSAVYCKAWQESVSGRPVPA